MIPKVIGKNILVTKIEREPVKNGLIIPVQVQESDYDALVVAVGNDVSQIKVDDVVILNTYRGITLKRDNITYIVIGEDEIVAVTKY